MTTETIPKTRPGFKLAFWLAVMLACDWGLYQTGKIAYDMAHAASTPVVAPVTAQEAPLKAEETAQQVFYIRQAMQGDHAFARRNNVDADNVAVAFNGTTQEWVIMTAYIIQHEGAEPEAAAEKALLVIQNARRMGIPVTDGMKG